MSYRSNIENEMRRFEAEIAGHGSAGGFIPTNSYFVPQQIHKAPQQYFAASSTIAKPAVITAKPKISKKPAVPTPAPPTIINPTVNISALQSEVTKKLQRLKHEKIDAKLAITQAKASSALQSYRHEDKKKGPKNSKYMRCAGGTSWDDQSLADWPEDDFRIFCGDLGNDVTDELLTRTFKKFPSFQKAKVIRDKRTNKSKGYGFVSFMDPEGYIQAMKEMNGRYVGSRPIKLKKSNWKQRSADIVKKKEKETNALIKKINSY